MAERPFGSVSIIGTGLIGSSIARAVREAMPGTRLLGFDADPEVRRRAGELALFDQVGDDPERLVSGAELVILCVPVGAMAEAALRIRGGLSPETIVSDVGSCKAGVAATLRSILPDARVVPAHPVAGTENSGPDAGLATLFRNRWCILTPDDGATPPEVERVADFWRRLGARVEVMDPEHHDLVLATTSHLPHLIAFTIVGTASDMERVTQGEVIKYSAGGFRDFTRIAASSPTMWRDIFLSNKDAVLRVLERFGEDLARMQSAIRDEDGDALFALFSRTSQIRRAIVEQGQDVAKPDFGRGGDQR